jgi:hypothetical protein
MEQQELSAGLERLQKWAFGNGQRGADEILRDHDRAIQQLHDEQITDKAKEVWAWMREQKDRDRMRASALYVAAASGVVSLMLQLVKSL